MRKVLAVALTALVIGILMPAAIGCAPEEFKVSGTIITTTSTMDMDVLAAMENNKWVFPKNYDSGEIHGTIEGTWESEYGMAIDIITGHVIMEGQLTFTGTVNGKSGSYVGHFYSTSQNLTSVSGTYITDFAITSGSGGLAGLTGNFHSEHEMDASGNTGTYSGTYRFE